MTAKKRISIDLRRWPLRLTFGVRPTIVIDGRTEPAQWGVGTWLVPADRPVQVSVFMFVVGIRFGEATGTLGTMDARLTYRAPWLAFRPGRVVTAAAPEGATAVISE